jgi:hypothetical protein
MKVEQIETAVLEMPYKKPLDKAWRDRYES